MLFNGEALDSSSDSSVGDLPLPSSIPLPAIPLEGSRGGVTLPFSRLSLQQNEYESYEAFSRKKLEAESERNSSNPTESKLQTPHSHFAMEKEQTVVERRTSPLKEQEKAMLKSHERQNILQNAALAKEKSNCSHDDSDSHFKKLLELEIQKNRELEQRLFQRQRLIVELQGKLQKQQKSKPRRSVCRSASPKPLQLRTVRQIQSEISQLKQKYEEIRRSPSNSKAMQRLRRENSAMKIHNRKYEKFFRAFTDSLNLLQKKQCGPDVRDVWESWKSIFPKVAEYLDKHKDC